MNRLTNDLRADMASLLATHKVSTMPLPKPEDEHALFDRVYAYLYNEDELKAINALVALRSRALATANNLYTDCGMRVSLRGRADQDRPVTEDIYRGSPVTIHPDDKRDPKLYGDLRNWAMAKQKRDEERRKACYEALNALKAFRTAKQLREAWPEAMPVIGHLLATDTVSRALPVVQIAELNKSFGLPPEKKDATNE